MASRAGYEKRDRKGGIAVRASGILVLLALLWPVSVAAQRSASTIATVQVPEVSSLELISATRQVEAPAASILAGSFSVRVRTNHEWVMKLTATVDGPERLWVRVSGTQSPYRRLKPGEEAVVASGGRGETTVQVEYRIEGAGPDPASIPVTYSLESAEL